MRIKCLKFIESYGYGNLLVVVEFYVDGFDLGGYWYGLCLDDGIS